VRKLRLIGITIVVIIALSSCSRFRLELYSDVKIEAESKYSKSPKKKTIERLLTEIWDSGFLNRNEMNREEIINNSYGIFKKSIAEANFAEGRACYLRGQGHKDRILLNRELFPHLAIIPGEDVFLKKLDKRIKGTLIHELFHDFWYNLLSPYDRYWFGKGAKKFYEEMKTASTTEDKLKFLSNIGYSLPRENNFKSYQELSLLKKNYPDQKFFGTELYSILAERTFSGKIIIPKQLRKFYKSIISRAVLDKSYL